MPRLAGTGRKTTADGEFSIVIAELRVLREPDLNALSATCVIILAVVGGVLYHFSDAAFGEFAERRLWTD